MVRKGLLSIGFWALQVYQFGPFSYRVTLGFMHHILAKRPEITCEVTIGVSVKFSRWLVIDHSGIVVLGCIAHQGVTIGNQYL